MIQIPLPVPIFRRIQFNGCTIGASKFISGQSFSSQQALFSGIQIGVAFNVLKDKVPKKFVCEEMRVAFQSPAAREEQKTTLIGINVKAVQKNRRSKIPEETHTKVVAQGSEKVKVQSSAGRTKFRHGQKEEKVIRTRTNMGAVPGKEWGDFKRVPLTLRRFFLSAQMFPKSQCRAQGSSYQIKFPPQPFQ